MSDQIAEMFPPEHSMRGDNAYYLNYCDHGDCRPGYAICANKVFAFNRDGTLFSESCLKAMRHGTCQAVDAVKQEKDAGKALFYVKRGEMITPAARPLVNIINKEIKRVPINKGPYPGEAPKVRKPAPVRPQVIVTPGDKPLDYADAINSALTELKPVKPTLNLPINPGYGLASTLAAVAHKPEPKPAVAKPAPVQQIKPDSRPAPKPAGGMSLLEIARLRMQKKA